jgi:two-component system NtrC family sensor kinase
MTESDRPPGAGAKAPGGGSPLETRNEAVARLEGDLEKLRALLREHMLQREAVEEELRASGEQYRLLAESMEDMVSLHGDDGSVLYVSPSASKLTGFAPHEYLTGDAFQFLHPEDRAVASSVLEAVLNGESPTLELRALCADGSHRWVEMRPRLVPAEGRSPRRVLCVTRDIEGRHRAEEALRRAEDRYRALFLRASHGIYRATPDGNFIDVNPALVRMLGYESADELLGANVGTTVYRDPADQASVLARLAAGELREWAEVRWRMKDGTPISVRLAIHAVRDDEGTLEGYEVIAEDVTERQRQDELLRRSERMASLGTTLAGVAHELNNPLAAIGGFAQLMLRESTASDEDRAALQTIHHESNRAAKIVRDLLTFARREESQQRERIDLNDVIGYLMATQRYAMETRGIERELKLAPDLPAVFAERTQIEQVALNLLVNARQALETMIDAPAEIGAGPRQRIPRIAVRTWTEGRQVLMEIADNGPGIPAELKSRIWDPFFTTKAEGEGTGLGLAMVHGIVTGYDGTIEVESEPGAGTRFIVSLPADTRTPPSVQSEVRGNTTPPREQAARALDILVVDDEPGLRRVLTRYFASRGHAVVSARDGSEAVKLARQSAFDVVICDLRLPGMDGYEVVSRIRALPTGVRTKCIIMSGGGPETIETLRNDTVMVSAVIEKPYDIEELRRAVEG